MFEPVVGVAQNGVQTIALRDKSGVMREVKATPEEVKEFLDQRKKYSSINKSYIMPSVIGAGLTTVVGFLAKMRGAGVLAALGLVGASVGAIGKGFQQAVKAQKAEQNFLDTHA